MWGGKGSPGLWEGPLNGNGLFVSVSIKPCNRTLASCVLCLATRSSSRNGTTPALPAVAENRLTSMHSSSELSDRRLNGHPRRNPVGVPTCAGIPVINIPVIINTLESHPQESLQESTVRILFDRLNQQNHLLAAGWRMPR